METKKRSTLKIILITIGVLVLIVLIAIGSFAFWAYKTTQSFNANDKSIVINNVDSFISYFNQGKMKEALELANPKYISLDAINSNLTQLQTIFNGYVKQDSNFTSYRINKYSDSEVVTYQTKAYFSDNTEGTLSVIAVKQNNEWKLESVNIKSSLSHLNGDIVLHGDEVDVNLKNTIVKAYDSQKSIYLSKDIKSIRNQILLSDPAVSKQIEKMSDSELLNSNLSQINAINILSATSTEIFSDHNSIWTFNKDKTTVFIKLPIMASSTNGQVGNIGQKGSYSNGQWHF